MEFSKHTTAPWNLMKLATAPWNLRNPQLLRGIFETNNCSVEFNETRNFFVEIIKLTIAPWNFRNSQLLRGNFETHISVEFRKDHPYRISTLSVTK